MKPLIFISPSEMYDPENHRPFYYLKRSYGTAIAGAGGCPIMPVEARFFSIYAKMADGLLLTDGSIPVNPGRYQEAVLQASGVEAFNFTSSPTRDSLDLSLCKAFIEAKKPIMGIGRGMEIINIALGGSLNQDPLGEYAKSHPIGKKHSITTAGIFEELLGKKTFVNSYHSQSLKKLGEGLKALAFAEDETIEAICHENLPIFGVLWNPETYKTEDEELFSMYQNADEDIALPKEIEEDIRKMAASKHPLKDYKTDEDAIKPKDNALFNYFIKLCRKEV